MNKIPQLLLQWIKSAVYAWVRIVGILVTLILLIVFFVNIFSSTPKLPKSAILKLELGGVFHEKEQSDFLSQLKSGSGKILYEVCNLIKEASKESKIEGIFVRLTPLSMSFAQIQELQEALLVFKKTGKKLYLYASDFPSTKEYYLASIFDEISTLPISEVGIAGFRLEKYFIRGLLDKWSVNPNMTHQGKYKSYGETFTEKDFSQPHRESSLSMLSSMETYVMNDIQVWRKITNIQNLFQQGNLPAKEALSEKLITRIGYLHSFEKEILDRHGQEAKFFLAKDYKRILENKSNPKDAEKYVTLLTLSGEIHDDRRSGEGHPFEDGIIWPAKVIKQLKEIMKDDKSIAIVLRIDSPGGSPIASEEIWAQIKEFSQTKPIIASMSSVAASGGYYIASGCSKIVAQPLTITGSIGVVGGKFNTSQFWEGLGIHWGEIYTMESATLHSTNRNYSPLQQSKIDSHMKHTYEIFKQRVAEGRHLTLDQVEQIAQGRVWTGIQAKENNLVDELGGISQAFEVAKKELKLEKNDKIKLYPYESGMGIQEIIMNVMGFEDDESEEISLLSSLRGMYDFCRAVFFRKSQFTVEG